MSGRRVSVSPPVALRRSARKKQQTVAGAAGAHHSLHLRQAVAGASSSNSGGPEMKLEFPGGAGPPLQSAEQVSDSLTVSLRLRSLRRHYKNRSELRPDVVNDLNQALTKTRKRILYRFNRADGDTLKLEERPRGATKAEQAYCALQEMAHQAKQDGNRKKSGAIHKALHEIDKRAVKDLQALYRKHPIAESLSTQAIPRPPAAVAPTVPVAATPVTVTPRLQPGNPAPAPGAGPSGPAPHPAGVAVQPPAISTAPVPGSLLPAPSAPGRTEEAAEVAPQAPTFFTVNGRLREFRGRCRPFPGTDISRESRNAVQRVSQIVLRRFTSFGGQLENLSWGRDSGVPRADQAYGALWAMAHQAEKDRDREKSEAIREVLDEIDKRADDELQALIEIDSAAPAPSTQSMQRPPSSVGPPATGAATPVPASTPPSGIAPGAPFPARSWLADDFAIERALIAGNLPSGFDTSRLIAEAGIFDDFGFAGELAAGRFPSATIDVMLRGYEACGEGGSYTRHIEYLRFLKENIEHALRAAYPGRVDREWLDQVRDILRRRTQLPAASAASGTGSPEIGRTATFRRLETPEGVSHQTPPPPPSSSGRTVAGAAALPLPLPFPFPLPLPERQAIVERFKADDALPEAAFVLKTGGAGALGWPTARWRGVLDDLYRLNDTARTNPAAAATLVDIDWLAIEALVPILDAFSHSP